MQDKMARPGGHLPLDPSRVSERGPWWMTNLRFPRFLPRLLPQVVVQRLREFKARTVTGFPRNIEFEQSLEDGQASATMSIVVPIHDAPTVTRRCLASLGKYAPESEIILVDDASSLTETVDIIQNFGNRNGWKVLHHEKPLGHSAACGAGASLATRPYLCLLNSDTVVTPWCWRRVKETFEQDRKIGVAGPSTSCAGNLQALSLAFVLRQHWNDNQICAFANSLLTQSQEPALMDLPWISGFALFVRRSLWDQIGGFDLQLPDYGNEVELCSRVAEKGYRIVWIRNSYIHHLGEQSYKESIGEEGIRARVIAAEVYTKQRKRSLAP